MCPAIRPECIASPSQPGVQAPPPRVHYSIWWHLPILILSSWDTLGWGTPSCTRRREDGHDEGYEKVNWITMRYLLPWTILSVSEFWNWLVIQFEAWDQRIPRAQCPRQHQLLSLLWIDYLHLPEQRQPVGASQLVTYVQIVQLFIRTVLVIKVTSPSSTIWSCGIKQQLIYKMFLCFDLDIFLKIVK